MAKIAAVKKELVLKPVINLSTSKTISTVIINETKPNVIKLIGKVNILKMVPIVALAIPISIPAINALKKPDTSTPGIK